MKLINLLVQRANKNEYDLVQPKWPSDRLVMSI